MPESCFINYKDCPLESRVANLESMQDKNSEAHREIFDRLRAAESDIKVQTAHYEAIDAKLDELKILVQDLTSKSGKRWDSVVDKVLILVVTAVVLFMLAKIGM